MNRLRDKRGVWPTSFLIVYAITVGIAARGLGETQKSGVLKRNGQVIWCKMQGKDAQTCNATYGYTPR